MPVAQSNVWGHTLRDTWRLEPDDVKLQKFLAADGLQLNAIQVPAETHRQGANPGPVDARRLRALAELYELSGLLYREEGEGGGIVRLTPLGRAVRDFLPNMNSANRRLLAPNAFLALNRAQLASPILKVSYTQEVKVFPARFIWRAMLELDGLSSDEIASEIMRTTDEQSLSEAIDRIRTARAGGATLRPRVTDENDRVIPIINQASFGWLLIAKKGGQETVYRFAKGMDRLAAAALSREPTAADWDSKEKYVRHIANGAMLGGPNA